MADPDPDPKRPKLSTTPLHSAIISNDPDKLWILALEKPELINVKVSTQQYEEFTPVHLAASLGQVECVRVLVQLNADLNVKDGLGRTVRHSISTDMQYNGPIKDSLLNTIHTGGARRCTENRENDRCKEGCSETGSDNGRTPPPPSATHLLGDLRTNHDPVPTPLEGLRVLLCDGGGIKGLSTLQMLLFLEQRFQHHAGDERTIHDYFDLYVGTSTGAIVAAALALGKSVMEIMSLYIQVEKVVFAGSPSYKLENLKKVLQDAFGITTKMGSLKKKVMIYATDIRHEERAVAVFENISNGVINPAGTNNLEEYVWKAVLRSASAPWLLELQNSRFIDGAFVGNNPTQLTMADLFELKKAMNDKQLTEKVVVSLGTSRCDPRPCSAEAINGGPITMWNFYQRIPANIGLARFAVGAATHSETDEVKKSRVTYSRLGIPYYRLNAFTSQDVHLDCKNLAILRGLTWDTYRYMTQFPKQFKALYDRLKPGPPPTH